VPEAYLDACCIIYMNEGAPEWRAAIASRLGALPESSGHVTSRISRLECRSKPMRAGDTTLLARYEATFATARVVDVTAAVIERATELRARYGFRTPDAIHLATALDACVDVSSRATLRSRGARRFRSTSSRRHHDGAVGARPRTAPHSRCHARPAASRATSRKR
jgi:predicted nucleic acid-binding protein